MSHPTPRTEGHHWAKLVCPDRMPAGEDWATGQWEVVRIHGFNPDAPDQPSDQLMALVGGVEPFQPLNAFIWGPRVPDYQPEEAAS